MLCCNAANSKLGAPGAALLARSCAAPTAPTLVARSAGHQWHPLKKWSIAVVTTRPSRAANHDARMPRSLSFLACASVATALTLTTRSRIPNAQPQELQQFLATPANWPRIVLSSVGVEGASTAAPLRPGSEVDELFGLPPVLPLRVKCRAKSNCRGASRAPDSLVDLRIGEMALRGRRRQYAGRSLRRRPRRRRDGLPHGFCDRSGRRRLGRRPRDVVRAGVALGSARRAGFDSRQLARIERAAATRVLGESPRSTKGFARSHVFRAAQYVAFRRRARDPGSSSRLERVNTMSVNKCHPPDTSGGMASVPRPAAAPRARRCVSKRPAAAYHHFGTSPRARRVPQLFF